MQAFAPTTIVKHQTNFRKYSKLIIYLISFWLVLLLPRLKEAGTQNQPARIITLSSGLHYNGEIMWDEVDTGRVMSSSSYEPFKAYPNCKLLNVVFAAELQR